MARCGWEDIFLLSEALMIVAYCLCTTMEKGMNSHATESADLIKENAEVAEMLAGMYPMFMDVHVLMFIGFGF